MKLRKLAMALGLGFAALGASAQTTVTGNMGVSATIAGTCGVTASALSFSVYDPAAATALSAQTTVAVNCSVGAGVLIVMGMGQNSVATPSVTRRLKTGTAGFLNYSIFAPTDGIPGTACTGSTTPWGGGTAATGGNALTIAAATTTAARTWNVCGQIPALQSTAPFGSYADTVVVTVTL